MKIAIITPEIFYVKGRRGGFAWISKTIGAELAKRGFDVFVITPRDPGFPEVLLLDNMKIITYSYSFGKRIKSIRDHIYNYISFARTLKEIGSKIDVFLSVEASVETLIAEFMFPNAKHVIWAQNPINWADYRLFGSINPAYRIPKSRFFIGKILFGHAYRNADLIFVQAKYFVDKLKRLYHVDVRKVIYLPNPIDYIPPESIIKKNEQPTICYLGRMDPEKRYWLFFELARKFPDIQFIAIGEPSKIFRSLYEIIVRKYIDLPNLKLAGFLDGFDKWNTLDKCWILMLPSINEGLPIAMLEALAHKCALLSSVNPDGLTKKFGYLTRKDNFDKGLLWLLENDRWKIFGENGYKYVNQNHSLERIFKRLCSFLEKIHEAR